MLVTRDTLWKLVQRKFWIVSSNFQFTFKVTVNPEVEARLKQKLCGHLPETWIEKEPAMDTTLDYFMKSNPVLFFFFCNDLSLCLSCLFVCCFLGQGFSV